MNLTKTIYSKDKGFERVSLDENEAEAPEEAIRLRNRWLMVECVGEAREVLGAKATQDQLLTIAVALFERRAIAAYVFHIEALDQKVHRLKSKQAGAKAPPAS